MTSQEEAILAQVDAQLNAMDTPSSAEVFYGLEEFSPRHQVAAAARVAKVGGGSQPENVRRLTVTVEAVDLLAGPVTLYTPSAGEALGPVALANIVLNDDTPSVIVYDDALDLTDILHQAFAGWDNDLFADAYRIKPFQDDNPSVSTGLALRAALALTGLGSGPADLWQANHTYDGSVTPAVVIGASHIWQTTDNGDSGGSPPDFAGNIGGTVVDNDVTWSDQGTLSSGQADILIDVCVPAAP